MRRAAALALGSYRRNSRALPTVFPIRFSFPQARNMSTPTVRESKLSFTEAPDLTDAPATILMHVEDKYDGVIIDSDKLPDSEAGFIEALDTSLSYWRSRNRRGVWLRIPIEKSTFIPHATSRGFVFHHAEQNYLMLTHWLSESENRMPANASHQVGVGCVVINTAGELLLVQEKSGPLRGTGIWKLPTGLTEAGEDLAEAAQREVQEETGISTRFVKFLCFRQAHNILFGKSDLFFVCVLEPLNAEIVAQEAEILKAEWCPANTLWDQKFYTKSPLYKLINEMIRHEVDAVLNRAQRSAGWLSRKLPIGFRPGDQVLNYSEDTLCPTPPPPPTAATEGAGLETAEALPGEKQGGVKPSYEVD